MLIDCVNYKWNHIILKYAMRSVIGNRMEVFRVILLTMLVVTGAVCRAEVIGGKVEDESGKPAEGIAVVALQLPDSVYMGGTVSDSTGVFRIETKTLPATKFLLRAEGIGYAKKLTAGRTGLDNIIVVTHGGIDLGEVAVTAKPRTEVSAGKFSFYPGELVSKVNDAFSVLKYAPLLDVSDFKDDISIIGLGAAKILINGKNSIMSSQAILQMLRASDGPRVKRVEIWVNPPVDRIGEGPIVNLVLAPRTGSMGSTDLFLSYSNRMSGRWQGWYGGEWDDWQVSLDMSVQHGAEKGTMYQKYASYKIEQGPGQDKTVPEPDIQRTTYSDTKSDTYTLTTGVGVSRDFHHDNSLGFAFNLWSASRKEIASDFTSYDMEHSFEEVSKTYKTRFRPEWTSGRLNYDHTLDTLGSNLRLWAVYRGSFYKTDNTYTPVERMRGFRNDFNTSSVEMSGKWTKNYNGKLSSTIGLSGFYDYLSNKMFYSGDGSLSGPLSLDDNLRQRQTSGDIFAGISYNPNALLSVNAGLRGRWFERKIEQLVQSVTRKFNDFYLLPNITLGLNFNQNNMLSAGYSMTVQQPRYADTNPIVTWISPTYALSGNPDLKAVTSHNLTLFYVLKQKISFGALAIMSNNVAVRGLIPLEGGATLYTPVEAGKTRDYKLLTSYNDYFFNYRWRVNGQLEWTLARMDNNKVPGILYNGAESDSRWNVSFSTALTLGGDRSWEISLNGRYESPQERTMLNIRGWADFGLTVIKNFSFGGRLWISADNLLNHKFKGWYDCEAYSMMSKARYNSRIFMVKFDINFGKQFRMRSNSSRDNFQSR